MENIVVAVRIKPSSKQAVQDCWRVMKDPHNGVILNMRNKQSYTFDQVFNEDSSNELIFDLLALPMIQSCLEGINGTIFAYGQTSSGKTFTMRGTNDSPGLMRLSLEYLFRFVSKSSERFLIKVSFFEIYNEQINDLLDPGKVNLEIREHPERGIYIDKVSEIVTESGFRALELLDLGESLRKVGETQMNSVSSRSHCVFRVLIESSNGFSSKSSQLNLVDLAGSEGVQKSKTEDLRSREGSNINKSLLSLSSVIQKLSDSKGSKGFINFRDSKITRLLQPSLTGNSRTAIICTVNPEASHYQESNNTLLFGMRAKRVKNDVSVNQMLIGEQQMKEMAAENKKLADRLQDLEKTANEFEALETNFKTLQELFQEKEKFYLQRIQSSSDQIKELADDLKNVQQVVVEAEDVKAQNLKFQVFVDELEKRIESKDFRINQLEANLSQLNRNYLELDSKYQKISLEKNEVRCLFDQLIDEKKLIEDERNRLNEIITAKEVLISKENQSKDKYLKLSENLNSELTKVQEKLENTQKYSEQLIERLNREVIDLQSERKESQDKIHSLESQILLNQIRDAEIEDCLKENRTLAETVQTFSEFLKKAKQKSKTLKEKTKFLASNHEKLISEKLKIIQDLQDEKIKNEIELHSLKEDFSSKSESLQSLESINETLKHELEELQKELDFQINEKLLLEQENFQLQYDYNAKENCITLSYNDKENPELSQIIKEKLEILENFELIKDELSQESLKSSTYAEVVKTHEKTIEAILTEKQETEAKLAEAEERIKDLKKQIKLKRTSQTLIDANVFKPFEESERFNAKVQTTALITENNLLNAENKELKQEIFRLKQEKFQPFPDSEKQRMKLEISELEKKYARVYNENGYLRAHIDRITKDQEQPQVAKRISVKKQPARVLDLGDSPKCKTM